MAKKKSYTLDRNTPKRTIISVRQMIVARLEALGKSRNWLAKNSGVRTATVYEFLAGKQDITTQTAELLMSCLGLQICSAPDTTSDTIKRSRKPSKSR